MSLIPPQIKFALIAGFCAILFFAGWTINGWRWEAKYADQLASARKTEQSLQETMDADTTRIYAEMQRIIDKRDATINGLRSRADRLPNGAGHSCQGATGRELSRQDAEFLVRFAADAEQHRQGAIACYASYDKIKAEINGN